MGMNYYLRLKEPERSERPLRDVIDWRYEEKIEERVLNGTVGVVDHHAVHIAKLSYGWVPNFQAVPASEPFGETEENNDRYSIQSVADIRRYMATGEYEIVNEEREVVSLETFMHRVDHWGEGRGPALRRHEEGDAMGTFLDPEGYQFSRRCFI